MSTHATPTVHVTAVAGLEGRVSQDLPSLRLARQVLDALDP